MRTEYAAALRARLAHLTMVVPDGQAGPDPSARLRVSIYRIRPHSEPSPGVIGTATGIVVGTLSALAGKRDAFFDGLFWGLWAGSTASDAGHYEHDRLGYTPIRVRAEVKLERPGVEEPLLEFSVSGSEVIAHMDPLDADNRGDEARIREEEAKAFASLVVARLQERFHWLPLPKPSYYVPEKVPSSPGTVISP